MSDSEKLDMIYKHFSNVKINKTDFGGEDFDLYSWCDGNVDDAFDMGRSQEESDTAEWILGIINGA